MAVILSNEILQSEKIAIKDDEGHILRYCEIAEKAERLNNVIWKNEKNLIFILCDNSMECVAFILQCLLENQTAMLLPDSISESFFCNLFQLYRPQYVFGSKYRNFYEWKEIYSEEVYRVFMTGEERYKIHPDIALLLSTSGSTGSPKMVKISHDNIAFNIKTVSETMGITAGDVGLSPLPLNFVYGFMFVFWVFCAGGTLCLSKEMILKKKYGDFFDKEKINIFAAVPSTWQMLERIKFWTTERAAQMKIGVTAGSLLSSALQDKLQHTLGGKLWSLYGQTEMLIIAGSNNFPCGAVGKALPGIDVKTEGADNELVVKSQGACMGYATSKISLQGGDENHGIFRTGDTGEIDEQGYIYIRGRIARFIKVLGKRISLDESEQLLENAFPKVNFACIGEDERFEAVYTGDCNIRDEVVDFLNHSIGIPARFVRLKNARVLPQNEHGKKDYMKIKEMYGK